MKRRRKKRAGLSELASFGEASFTHPTAESRPEVIQVEAEEVYPEEAIDAEGFEDDLGGGFLSFFMGGKKNLPADLTYQVETEGKSFNDKRMFTYSEEGGKWRLVAGWTAEGIGSVPPGIRMLGSFQGIFNQLFNMVTGSRIENQTVRHSTDRKSPVFPNLLPYKKKES